MRRVLPLMCVGLVAAVCGCAKQKVASRVAWLTEYEAGVKAAQEAGKPLMVDVYGPGCGACEKLDKEVFSRADVGGLSKQFVAVKVNGDERRDLVGKFDVSGYPTTLFLTAEEKELNRVRGAVPYRDMLEAMRDARGKFGKGK